MADDETPDDDPSGKRDIPLDADLLFTKYENQKRAAQKALDKVEELENHAYKLRQEKKELKRKVPSEGGVVLSPSEAEKLRDLGVLGEDGVKASDLEQELEAGREARQKLQKIEAQKRRKEVANTAGVDAGALQMATKALDTDVEYEIQGEGENASVVVNPEDGDPQDFDDFAEKHFSTLEGALYDTDSDEDEGGEGEDGSQEGPSGPSPNAPSTQAGEGNRPSGSDDEDEGRERGYRFESDQDAEW